jgi:hypothetical protein
MKSDCESKKIGETQRRHFLKRFPHLSVCLFVCLALSHFIGYCHRYDLRSSLIESIAWKKPGLPHSLRLNRERVHTSTLCTCVSELKKKLPSILSKTMITFPFDIE